MDCILRGTQPIQLSLSGFVRSMIRYHFRLTCVAKHNIGAPCVRTTTHPLPLRISYCNAAATQLSIAPLTRNHEPYRGLGRRISSINTSGLSGRRT